jgi:hypothetical protein
LSLKAADSFLLKLALFLNVFYFFRLLYKKVPSVSQFGNFLIILFYHLLDRFWLGTGALKTRLASTICSMFLAARCSDLLAF